MFFNSAFILSFLIASPLLAASRITVASQQQDYNKVIALYDSSNEVKPDAKDLMLAEAFSALQLWNAQIDLSLESAAKNPQLARPLADLIDVNGMGANFELSERQKAKISALPSASPLKEVLQNLKGPQLATEQAQQLSRARAFYAKAQYDQAIAVYEQINAKHPQFIASREELAWAYLMNKNLDASLGLTNDLLNTSIQASARLESRFLAGYAYLKKCHFDEVKNQAVLFQKEMQKVVAQVADGKKKGIWTLGWTPSQISSLTKKEQQLNKEIQVLKSKTRFSNAFKEQLVEIKRNKLAAQKQSYENYEKLMSESLLKMQFLRLELLTLMHQIENKKIKTSEIVADAADSKKSKQASVQFVAAQNEIWPDEVYKTETSLNNLCTNTL